MKDRREVAKVEPRDSTEILRRGTESLKQLGSALAGKPDSVEWRTPKGGANQTPQDR